MAKIVLFQVTLCLVLFSLAYSADAPAAAAGQAKGAAEAKGAADGGVTVPDESPEALKVAPIQKETPSQVVVLTEQNYYKTVAKGFWFVKYYAPWCGHCNDMAPSFKKLGDNFAKNNSVNIGELNCDDAGDLCGKINITGYPTVSWVANGKKTEDYQGPRKVKPMTEFIDQMLYWVEFEKEMERERREGPFQGEDFEGVLALDDKEWNQVMPRVSVAFVHFYSQDCLPCKKLGPTWEVLAKEYYKNNAVLAKVDCTANKKTCEQNKITRFPTLQIFKAGKLVSDYKGVGSRANLSKFFKPHVPPVPKVEL